jgi:hypothetical protein
MFIIEYHGGAKAEPHSELALGSTLAEARDQADTHLEKMKAKFGAVGYRIIDRDKKCVATGPAGFKA